jgi:hypothetical protein
MSQQKKTSSTAAKNPEKLIPRTAPAAEISLPASEPLAENLPPEVTSEALPAPATVPATAAAVKPAKKAPAAKARKIAAPLSPEEPRPIKQPLGKPAKVKKAVKEEKPAKVKKLKLVRDSYAMPEAEYAQIGALKKRLSNGFSLDVKKSELLRAGIALLAALNDSDLQSALSQVERIKTGRPAK